MTDWQDKLGNFFESTENANKEKFGAELGRFLTGTVLPAFQEVRREMLRYGRDVVIRDTESAASVSVSRDGDEELTYRIQGRTFPTKVLPFVEVRFKERKGLKLIRVEHMFREGSDYSMSDVTSEEIINDFVENYVRRVENQG